MKTSRKYLQILLYLVLILICLLQCLPFYLALNASLKPGTDLSSTIVPRLADIEWENWGRAFTEGNILGAILNSAIVTAISTLLVCLIGAFAAYPLARRITRFNKAVSAVIIAMMMIPPLSTLVPLYSMLVQMGAINTYWGIILVHTTGNLPLAIFLYTSFIKAIPTSVDEAGMIDGASSWRICVQLILPMLKPVTATVVIMSATNIWNEYALSNYILADPNMQTIAPRVASFFSANASSLGLAAASALMSAAPIVIVYLFLQKYFIAGMVAGVEK
ncbi:carbohydrate ABC transporter permease [Arcanobacterium hippocoleae]|uniref:carbohydrate ABC transporter permease n=1 Tax=Arcanobacterium hippocoleae TaxID=149017 RepID=UPI00333F70BE